MHYFWAIIKHKWFVLLASFKTGLPLWLAITHDLSKLTWAELPHYSRQFFGDKGDPEGFAIAWLHHQNRNDHHWEWWVTRSDYNQHAINGCLPMSSIAILHMITDWIAVRRAQFETWDSSKWKPLGLYNAKVHPDTRKRVSSELKRLKMNQNPKGLEYP